MDDIKAANEAAQPEKEAAESMAHCNARREFLARAGVAAGGLVLGLAGTQAIAQEPAPADAPPPPPDVVVKLADNAKLYEVGGSVAVNTPNGKVNVVHPDEATFVACSAICTHKGGQLAYDPATKQFACPVHGARFDLNGNVVRGPAKQPLATYTADPALVVAPKLQPQPQ
jgi:Rieske Fe-S protein